MQIIQGETEAVQERVSTHNPREQIESSRTVMAAGVCAGRGCPPHGG
jgi:hypothetical protein